MTSKTSYWIRDVEGNYAQVEGAADRDTFTKVRGWSEADEPGPTDQVHVVNENPQIGPGRLPYGALAGWAGQGWRPGPPPAPVDLTRPAPAEQATSTPATGPAPAKTATSGDKKES